MPQIHRELAIGKGEIFKTISVRIVRPPSFSAANPAQGYTARPGYPSKYAARGRRVLGEDDFLEVNRVGSERHPRTREEVGDDQPVVAGGGGDPPIAIGSDEPVAPLETWERDAHDPAVLGAVRQCLLVAVAGGREQQRQSRQTRVPSRGGAP
jgi:hypothetical protein